MKKRIDGRIRNRRGARMRQFPKRERRPSEEEPSSLWDDGFESGRV